MIEFVESPISSNWLHKQKPKEKLIIVTPFVKKNSLVRLLNFYDVFSAGIEVYILIRAKIDDFLMGSTDIEVMKYLSELENNNDKFHVKILSNLHMKAYCIDDKKLLITSGNLTQRGAMNTGVKANVEGGLATDDENACEAFLSYFWNVYSAGATIGDFKIEKVQSKLKKNSKGRKTIEKRTDVYNIPVPQKLYEYPEKDETDQDKDMTFFRFELQSCLELMQFDGKPREWIPQNASKGNYIKAMQFINDSIEENRTLEKLAEHIGSKAQKYETKIRVSSGMVKNLKLLGFIANNDCINGIIPQITEIGKQYLDASDEDKKILIGKQAQALPWMKHIRIMKENNPDAKMDLILKEYLCNVPYQYSKTSASRYAPAMKYFCELNDL